MEIVLISADMNKGIILTMGVIGDIPTMGITGNIPTMGIGGQR